ncbi:MAG: hypothetical protein J1E58_10140, partial [Prevotella sp.]|nr:hypothetical protein [Prevotella sp.]
HKMSRRRAQNGARWSTKWDVAEHPIKQHSAQNVGLFDCKKMLLYEKFNPTQQLNNRKRSTAETEIFEVFSAFML